jgi:hypothetical protein
MKMTIAKNLLFKRHGEKITDIDPDALSIIENSFSLIGSSFGNKGYIRKEGKVLPT